MDPSKAGRPRWHATGHRSRECDDSDGDYRCKRCRRVCCWCFGAADELPGHCDDCWVDLHPDWMNGLNARDPRAG